jgi:hypothetical protein
VMCRAPPGFGRHTVAKCPFLDCVKALAKKGKHALQCQDRHGNTPLRTLEAPGIEFLKMCCTARPLTRAAPPLPGDLVESSGTCQRALP